MHYVLILLFAMMSGSFCAHGLTVDFEEPCQIALPDYLKVWKNSPGVKISVVDNCGFDSSRALEIRDENNRSCAIYRFKVEKQSRYRISVMARTSGLQKPVFKICWMDKEGKFNWNLPIYNSNFFPYHKFWQKAFLDVNTPADAVYLAVLLGVENQKDAQTTWFDNIIIEKSQPDFVRQSVGNTPEVKIEKNLPATTFSSNKEVLETMRMRVFKHAAEGKKEQPDLKTFWYPPLLPSEFAEELKSIRKQGFNCIITEGQRYLLKERNDETTHEVLKGSLPFEELCENTALVIRLAHQEKLKVYLHLTACLAARSVRRENPEQLTRSIISGQPQTVWTHEWYCPNYPGFKENFLKRLDTLCKKAGPDGVMIDETAIMGEGCGCRYCRQKFQQETNLAMPDDAISWFDKSDNPVFRAFLRWRIRQRIEFNKQIKHVLRKHVPDGVLLTYYALPGYEKAWRNHSYDMALQIKELFADSAAGHEQISDFQRFWPMLIGHLKIVRSYADPHGTPIFDIRNVAGRHQSLFHWLLGLSQGAHRYWEHNQSGKLMEERTGQVLWEQKYQALLAGLKAAGNTAILLPGGYDLHNQPIGFINRKNAVLSFANLLTVGQISYRLLAEGSLNSSPELPDDIMTLILPDCAMLSEASAAKIRRFVARGGTLIATAESSIFDEAVSRRTNYALSDVFGCNDLNAVKQGGFLTLEGEEIFMPEKFMTVTLLPGAEASAMLKTERGDMVPAIVKNRFGKGMSYYFAFPVETLIYYSRFQDNRILPRSGEELPGSELLRNYIVKTVAQSPAYIFHRNLPRGVVIEPYRHQWRELSGTLVKLLNFQGMYHGKLPENRTFSYPDPDTSGSVISVKDDNYNAVYAFSPDFISLVQVPYRRRNGNVEVSVPPFKTFIALYFSRNSEQLLRKYIPGEIAGKELK